MPTLSWLGKKKIVNHHLDVPFHVLDKKYNFESKVKNTNNSADNKIIHGDNLAVLKSLLPEFEGKVDCIYIDPPYNTGNEKWVYNDNVNDPRIKKWLNTVVGKEGDDLSRHDKWLCMMYPRLKLLKKLLAKDGVIFISIDDNELLNLKFICDEIFGAKNFIANLIWNTEGNTDNQFEIKVNHEYVLMYVADSNYKSDAIGNVIDPNTREDSNLWKGFADNNINKNNPANPPAIFLIPKGFPAVVDTLEYKAKKLDATFFEITSFEKKISDSVKIKYDIEKSSGLPVKIDDLIIKDGKVVKDCRVYGGFANRKKLDLFVKNDFKPIMDDSGELIEFYINANSAIRYRKIVEQPSNILSVLRGFGTTERMRGELKRMGLEFTYPKPIEFISYLLQIATQHKKNALILDSFAGSATTAHAVLKLNNEDSGNRRFILSEMMDYAETITAERVRRVMNGYGEGKTKIDGLGGSFEFFELGEPLFLENELLNESIGIERIRQYVSYSERIPLEQQLPIENNISPSALGVNEQTLWLFNYDENAVTSLDLGFLGSLNLRELKQRPSQYVIYADKCVLETKFMQDHGITFKRIPRDILRF
ncbi:site-specific DNA-methyltransferase [Acinetobacter tianfuensis]|uniref:site-specific DNA-methyltransferase (adenine-specific) n=1 Tax=Acinetobacter tianfuensis TaxID=2419603 RepID=A0A3A8E5T3_9GAMM|nr:site-specific DNA-methyltransferase [Acinetobacter tianfuensis]RKG30187.1 site-specific DNA-methyltransferase [Acinetobacter tianfuensis]